MADVKISGLPASTTPLAGSEVLPIVQGGVTKQVSVNNLTAGKATSALSNSLGTGTSVFSIPGTQLSLNNTGTNVYASVYGGAGLTNGGFLLGGNNTENQANFFWNETGNYLQMAANPASSKIKLIAAGVDVGDITSNGYAPSSGKGIDFSATAGAGTSELLNDYEEGTWTPAVTAGTGTITTVGAVVGRYTKIGRQVTLMFSAVITTNGTGAGYILITGMPFTPNSDFGNYNGMGSNSSTGKAFSISNSSTNIYVYYYDATYPVASGQVLYGSFIYNV